MRCAPWHHLRGFVRRTTAGIRTHLVLLLILLIPILLVGCYPHHGMSFEQDRPMNTSAEQDFFQQPLVPQRAAMQSQSDRILHADHTEEESYLNNIVELLEQTKMLSANAERQVQPQQRKVFNYGAFEIDIDTVIFAIKRYLAADDYTPRGFQALPPARLKGSYSDVE